MLENNLSSLNVVQMWQTGHMLDEKWGEQLGYFHIKFLMIVHMKHSLQLSVLCYNDWMVLMEHPLPTDLFQQSESCLVLSSLCHSLLLQLSCSGKSFYQADDRVVLSVVCLHLLHHLFPGNPCLQCNIHLQLNYFQVYMAQNKH